VRIGDVVVDNVAGSVVSGRLDQSLLGMSFLRRLSGFEFRGNEMVLRQ
jgi:aspartyl protease family protein